jgi:hypothetical protein
MKLRLKTLHPKSLLAKRPASEDAVADEGEES